MKTCVWYDNKSSRASSPVLCATLEKIKSMMTQALMIIGEPMGARSLTQVPLLYVQDGVSRPIHHPKTRILARGA